MPQPYSSPFFERNKENVDPQNIFEICSSYKVSIFRGSGTLLFSIPNPGSNESDEKPRPSYPYRLIPHPYIEPFLHKHIEWVSPHAI